MTDFSFDAILWDFDGTLVDTEGLWLDEELGVAADFGADLPHDFWRETVGGPVLETAQYIAARMTPRGDPEAIADALVQRVEDRLRREAPPWLPGAQELLAAARAAQLTQALVSASWRRVLDPVLEQVAPGQFAAVVSGEQVTHGKPHPEPYLTAADRLGLDPARCLAVEDSPTGSASANAAGCVVLAVSNVLAPPPAPRRVHVESLAGLTLDDLDRLFLDGVRA